MSVRFGTNDVARARAFYDATFAALGVAKSDVPAEYPMALYRMPGGPAFLIGPARDGQPATHANGGTVIFAADSDDAVKAWHAAGLVRPSPRRAGPSAPTCAIPTATRSAAITACRWADAPPCGTYPPDFAARRGRIGWTSRARFCKGLRPCGSSTSSPYARSAARCACC
jgi:hypothetical protein